MPIKDLSGGKSVIKIQKISNYEWIALKNTGNVFLVLKMDNIFQYLWLSFEFSIIICPSHSEVCTK